MSQTKSGTTSEQLVSETDHVELSRLVTEHAWRADQGRADTIHELYVDDGELVVGPTPLRGREAILEWGRQLAVNAPWRSIRHVCGNMRFVSDGPEAAKARLSSPSSWSRDRSRPPLNLSAWVRITIGSFAPSKDGALSRDVGSSCSREATS
jgi:SnoaL-like protein